MKHIFLSIASVIIAFAFTAASSGQTPETRQINGGFLNGKAISLPKPDYPDSAREAGIGGAVTVNIIVDEDGNVTWAEAEINKPKSGDDGELALPMDPSLREAAENAARMAKFSPTFLSGQPVRIKGKVIYNFGADADQVKTPKVISGGVVNGKALTLPKTEIPAAARAVGAEGTVTVQISVDENGDVTDAKAVSGHPLLRNASEAAARGAKFAPTLLNGEPVKIVGVLTFNFAFPKLTEQ